MDYTEVKELWLRANPGASHERAVREVERIRLEVTRSSPQLQPRGIWLETARRLDLVEQQPIQSPLILIG